MCLMDTSVGGSDSFCKIRGMGSYTAPSLPSNPARIRTVLFTSQAVLVRPLLEDPMNPFAELTAT